MKDGPNRFVVVPHWGSVKYGEVITAAKLNLDNKGYKTIPLTDEQFILIEDNLIV